MVQAITATYVQEEDDWTIKVAGLGQELKGRAPGIIAARDRADQLVEKLVPEGSSPTVVHLLNGSALEFTTAYMTARLARPEPVVTEQPAAEEETSADDAQATEVTVASTDSDDKREVTSEKDTADVGEDESPAATDSEQGTTSATAPQQATTEPETQEQSGKPAVPRKELSKSPGNATGNLRTPAEEGRWTGGAYVSSAAGSMPRAAGSASATG